MERKTYSLNDGREVKIRPASLEDKNQLEQLYNVITENSPQEVHSVQQFNQRFQFPDYYISLVTEHDGKVIGYGEIKKDHNKHNGELQIHVHPDFQRLGLGTAMMIILLKEATDQRLNVIHLKVESENIGAIALFRKFGFQQDYIEQEKNSQGEPHDILFMSHKLRGIEPKSF
jgi:ribosomal protein S18 acetylase RimI-like enzyme